ncbi:protein FAM207A [Scophthalmus maximus]|uniref:SLX9 ribosome biogenesis factor n=1 Tax=Scophthalmus maximus TaxID=52904 RepID=A0A8D3AB30_SCOMX|nr:protein FAM207A [Scophthalmus maximus]
MVGKIKHVRQKLHQEAVRLVQPSGLGAAPCPVLSPPSVRDPQSGDQAPRPLAESSFPAGIFAGTKITPEALVQTLKFEEAPDTPTPCRKGTEERKVKPKKEKMKERREKWMNKIRSIKLAQEQQAAEARRQAMPVVGDLRPLADALPELCQLIGPPTAPSARRKSRKNKMPVKRPEPTDFSQMKQSQKRKLLETESSRFNNVVKTLCGKMKPLADIGEQLRKRMKQEEEQGPS